MSKSLLLLLLGGLLLGLDWGAILAATEQPMPKPRPPMPVVRPPHDRIMPPWPGLRVSMEVLVDNQPLRTIHHHGRTYLPVPRLGVEYALRISNQGSRRITAVVSVDGLSVLNGQIASEEHPGYIVGPHDHIVIRGWQRDRETAAAFRFEPREQSHAWKVGRPENIGVLGLIAIEEYGTRPRLEVEQKGASAPAPARAHRDVGVGGTGTGLGRDVGSSIHYVPFIRGHNKRAITIYYDTEDALRRAGIPVDRPYPRPFP